MDKDDLILRRHLIDRAKIADQRGIILFSDFLNINEQNIFSQIKGELPDIRYFLFGGFSDAERKVICFCGDYGYREEDIEFPIECLKIVAQNKKFSDDLTHRDFLGAILNLGIDRSVIGDIIIMENEGFLFCTSGISTFILDNLFKIKHTMVDVSIIPNSDFNYTPKLKEISGTVSSVRLDSILSVALRKSRSSLTRLIAGGKVFVNSREVLSNSYALKENDIVSVRGHGKFIYKGTTNVTKKGRYSVRILLYI